MLCTSVDHDNKDKSCMAVRNIGTAIFLKCRGQQPVGSTCAQWLASLSSIAQALGCIGTVLQGKLKWCRKHLGKSSVTAPLSLFVCDPLLACWAV